MKFSILTLFPEMFKPLSQSIIGRALEKKLIELELINIRDFSSNKHKKVDDYPYGGGSGMVLMPDVVYDAYNSIAHTNAKVVYLSPQGKVLTQDKAKELATCSHLVLICGHYEGIDQRVLDEINPEEISIGDYILTGGELPAMVLIDTISRNIQGVLSKNATDEESFSSINTLEYPQYTRPEVWKNRKVPEVLISGHHRNIQEYRKEQSLINTYKKRPELLENINLSDKQKQVLKRYENRKED